MKISISKSKSKFTPMNVNGFMGLQSLIKRHTWSCGVFKDNYRIAKNFLYADTIALDFDGGYTLEEANAAFNNHKHVIGTTKSHDDFGQHRFRVILFLSEPIIDHKIYQETVRGLLEMYSHADKNCSDASRMWYPCKDIVSINNNGLTIPVAATPSLSKPQVEKLPPLDFSRKPSGWSNCIWSIANGRFKKGEGNDAMMSLATNLKKLNHSKSQAYHMCKDAYQLRGADYDSDGLWREVICKVYDNWDGARYVCTKEGTWLNSYCTGLGVNCCPAKKSAFEFTKLSDLTKSAPQIDYLVDGLLTTGGISIIAGPPKSGKSTIVRQLTKSIVTGQKFLGRSTKKGKVVYLALEEQGAVLNEQFGKVGISDSEDVLIHVGGLLSGNSFDELSELLLDKRPELLIIDTMLLFLSQSDSNNYNEMNRALAACRDLARRSGTHILTVHHQNKPPPGFSTANRGATSIHGSTAIHGAMDCALIFNRERDRRFITSSQRGGTPFTAEELEFDSDTETYKLKGKALNDEF